MKKSIAKNYIYNLIYKILILLIPLITTPYVSRVLGAENIGIYSYTISIVTYFITFGSLGIVLYGQREIAFLQNSKKKYTKSFYEIFILRVITMMISMVLFYFTFVFRDNNYKVYFFILLFEMFANIIDISWFFMGLEEFKKTIIRNIIVKIISLITIFLFVKTKNDLNIYFYIYVISNFCANLSLWFYLPKFLIKITIKEINIIKHLKPTIALFIPQIATQVYTLLDKSMLGTMIIDKSQVGFYEQAEKIIKVLLTVITSLGTVMMPRIANNYALGNNKKISEYMKKSFNIVFLLSFPLIFGLISISSSFVPIFFGKGYDSVSLLMIILTPIILFIGMSNVTGTQYLLPTKRQKEYTISVVLGAIVNFICNIFLIPRYGSYGASVGTVIAEFVVTFTQAFFVRKDFNMINIYKLSIKYLICSIIMFIICFVISITISNNYISILLQIIIGSATYFSMLLLLKDKFILERINRFLKNHIKEV